MKKKIIFTGGGSGGHAVSALTIIGYLNEHKWDIYYIGSKKGIERDLITANNMKIRYYSVFSGKLRRYFSFKNLFDLIFIALGFLQSLFIIIKLGRGCKTLFSTGGFVALPPVIAARILGKKIFIHEQTSRAGLANKISSFFANKVFISFEKSKEYFNKNKIIYSGYPLRSDFFTAKTKKFVFHDIDVNKIKRPLFLITGGGNGSKLVNELIKSNLDYLKKKYFIVHQVGKTFIDQYLIYKEKSYYPVAYLGVEMIELMKRADIIVSRSGAGTVMELITLGKPSIFIPLKIAQKNEQYHNAMEAHNKIGSIIIQEKDLKNISLKKIITDLKKIKIKKVSKKDITKKIIFDNINQCY